MEFLDVTSETRKSQDLRRSPPLRSRSPSRKPSSSRYRERSQSRSGLSSRNILGSRTSKNGRSRNSLFGGNSSSSYYKRSPRSNYLARTFKKLRRLLRDLIYYIKRHPYKVFMLVIVPLIVSGALADLLAKFGIRLPVGLEKALRIASGSADVRRGGQSTSAKGSWMNSARNILGGLGGLGGIIGMLKMIK